MMQTRTLRYTLFGLGAVVTLLLVGCGGAGEGTPATGPATTALEEPTTAALAVGPAFAVLPAEVTTCLENHGVTVPQRGGTGGPNNSPDQAAIQECADEAGIELPERAGGGRAGSAAPDQEALVECLIEQGIEVELTDGAPAPGGLVGSLDLEDPEVAAALESCGFTPGARGAVS